MPQLLTAEHTRLNFTTWLHMMKQDCRQADGSRLQSTDTQAADCRAHSLKSTMCLHILKQVVLGTSQCLLISVESAHRASCCRVQVVEVHTAPVHRKTGGFAEEWVLSA